MPQPSWTFDGVVRLTKVGTTYLLLTLVIGFAALNTGNNALYIGLTFLLGCLLLSGIASKGGLKHLRIEIVAPTELWAMKPVEARLVVKNDSRIWNVRDVVIVAPELEEPGFIPVIARRTSVELPVSLLFRRRGRVEVRTFDLYTRYPFGLFLKKRRVTVGGEAIVYPRLLDGTAERERLKPVTGDSSSANRPGAGADLHSFRDFNRGDSIRQVHWKKSASVGRWIIKQTELESARVVHVVVDPYKPRRASDEAFEEMISDATTFIHDVLMRGMEVVVTLPRQTIRTREGEGAGAVFKALALIAPIHEPLHHAADRATVVFRLPEAP